MSAFPFLLLGIALLPLGLGAYAYGLYPLLAWLLARRRPVRAAPRAGGWRPRVDVLVACHDAGTELAATLDALLASDCPEVRHIVVASDASTDGTDAIARRYAARGVTLVRVVPRGGKTVAENVALRLLDGDVVVHVDAASRVRPDALRALVEALGDPGVGIASGRDVPVRGPEHATSLLGALYVRWEMWLRRHESRAGMLVGASGCLYAVRAPLAQLALAPHLTRDFAIVLEGRRRGLRAVSVDAALCEVRASASVAGEWRRMERTMLQGLGTLGHYAELLLPWRGGTFALALASHKLARWLALATALPAWLLVVAGVAASGIAGSAWNGHALAAPAALAVLVVLGGVGRCWPRGRAPAALGLVALALGAGVGAARALWRAMQGARLIAWEPTRRR